MRRAYSRSLLCFLFLIVLLFTIGCLFIYWAIDNYIGSHFDSDRYSFSKIQVNGNDTYMGWKFDKRTGAVEFCGKTTNPEEPVICYKPRHLKVDEEATKGLELDRADQQISQKQCTQIVNDMMVEMERWRAEEGKKTSDAAADNASKSSAKPAQKRQ
jgi:hypothetical protein